MTPSDDRNYAVLVYTETETSDYNYSVWNTQDILRMDRSSWQWPTVTRIHIKPGTTLYHREVRSILRKQKTAWTK